MKSILVTVLVFRSSFLIFLLIFFTFSPSHAQPDNPKHAFEQNHRLGRGGNFGNILYQWDEWDKAGDQKDMDVMKEEGMTGLRINLRPFLHMNRPEQYALIQDEAHGRRLDLLLNEGPPYKISDAFFERLDWTVHEALKRGFTVIIDNHQYRVMGKDPMALREMFLASWEQMAAHYKDYPDNVYFGLLNEPNNHLTPYLWNYFMMDAYEIVRKSNPGRTLVIGPGNWNGFSALDELKLPKADRNIIVEVHYYSPHRFTHQGVDGRPTGITWRGTKEEKQAVIDDFNKAAAWGRKNDRPLFLGEFAVINKADTLSAQLWLKFVVEQMEHHGMSWSMWNLMGSNMGAYDQQSDAWIQHRKNAILPPRRW